MVPSSRPLRYHHHRSSPHHRRRLSHTTLPPLSSPCSQTSQPPSLRDLSPMSGNSISDGELPDIADPHSKARPLPTLRQSAKVEELKRALGDIRDCIDHIRQNASLPASYCSGPTCGYTLYELSELICQETNEEAGPHFPLCLRKTNLEAFFPVHRLSPPFGRPPPPPPTTTYIQQTSMTSGGGNMVKNALTVTAVKPSGGTNNVPPPPRTPQVGNNPLLSSSSPSTSTSSPPLRPSQLDTPPSPGRRKRPFARYFGPDEEEEELNLPDTGKALTGGAEGEGGDGWYVNADLLLLGFEPNTPPPSSFLPPSKQTTNTKSSTQLPPPCPSCPSASSRCDRCVWLHCRWSRYAKRHLHHHRTRTCHLCMSATCETLTQPTHGRCPAQRCSICWMRGHSADTCPRDLRTLQRLTEAATNLRDKDKNTQGPCVSCGSSRHLFCHRLPNAHGCGVRRVRSCQRVDEVHSHLHSHWFARKVVWDEARQVRVKRYMTQYGLLQDGEAISEEEEPQLLFL
eukprot:GHVS01076041.1.p1 GENE.GHVS01076041.1~~GHVS01076041.1.p1  ORF type:complete len:534 (+),score=109.11 GHVS01076041.1:67-1602(+)